MAANTRASSNNTRNPRASIDEVLKLQIQLRDDLSKQIEEVNLAVIQSQQSNQVIIQLLRILINKQSANPAIESPTLNPALSEKMTSSWVGKDKIVVQTGLSRRSDFYLVDLRGNEVIKLKGGSLWNHSELIAAGSVIYAIGDSNRFYDSEEEEELDVDCHIHSGASVLDLEDPNGSCWKGIGGMLNCDRSFPGCASLGDRIFVLGAGDGSSPFGEFYDMKNGSWQPIPISGIGIDHSKMHIWRSTISDPKHNRILVFFTSLNSLYAYYPDKNHQWVCLDNHMLDWRGEPAPSAVDNVLYFIISHTDYNNGFTAYDILTKKCLKVSWSSSDPFGPNIVDKRTFTQVLYLGDNILCLTTHAYTGDPCVLLWEYYRFHVCRLSEQEVLLTPLSVHPLPAGSRDPPINSITL